MGSNEIKILSAGGVLKPLKPFTHDSILMFSPLLYEPARG